LFNFNVALRNFLNETLKSRVRTALWLVILRSHQINDIDSLKSALEDETRRTILVSEDSETQDQTLQECQLILKRLKQMQLQTESTTHAAFVEKKAASQPTIVPLTFTTSSTSSSSFHYSTLSSLSTLTEATQKNDTEFRETLKSKFSRLFSFFTQCMTFLAIMFVCLMSDNKCSPLLNCSTNT
jgi:hypothetical protein